MPSTIVINILFSTSVIVLSTIWAYWMGIIPFFLTLYYRAQQIKADAALAAAEAETARLNDLKTAAATEAASCDDDDTSSICSGVSSTSSSTSSSTTTTTADDDFPMRTKGELLAGLLGMAVAAAKPKRADPENRLLRPRRSFTEKLLTKTHTRLHLTKTAAKHPQLRPYFDGSYEQLCTVATAGGHPGFAMTEAQFHANQARWMRHFAGVRAEQKAIRKERAFGDVVERWRSHF